MNRCWGMCLRVRQAFLQCLSRSLTKVPDVSHSRRACCVASGQASSPTRAATAVQLAATSAVWLFFFSQSSILPLPVKYFADASVLKGSNKGFHIFLVTTSTCLGSTEVLFQIGRSCSGRWHERARNATVCCLEVLLWARSEISQEARYPAGTLRASDIQAVTELAQSSVGAGPRAGARPPAGLGVSRRSHGACRVTSNQRDEIQDHE